MTDTKAQLDISGATGHRNAYKAPAVIDYGTLRDVTLTVGNKGLPDGPLGGNKDRTQV